MYFCTIRFNLEDVDVAQVLLKGRTIRHCTRQVADFIEDVFVQCKHYRGISGILEALMLAEEAGYDLYLGGMIRDYHKFVADTGHCWVGTAHRVVEIGGSDCLIYRTGGGGTVCSVDTDNTDANALKGMAELLRVRCAR